MAAATIPLSQAEFYRRFLMARTNFDPPDFGVDMNKDEFTDLLVGEFADYTKGTITLDELLLRPRAAMHFCDMVRQKHAWHDLPDDIILRTIMARRKNPGR